MSDLQARLDLFVARAGDLYSLPRVAAEVLELTRDATVDTTRLKQCIEKDPALVAKLLRVVNSSLFGLCREVSDLNQALALLGIKPLKLLVLGFSLPEGLFRNVAADFLSGYWRHTLTTAVAAREICTVLNQPAGDEAFIAGLLKHLGMLVLVQQVGSPYVQFVERMQAHGMDLLAAEKLALGFDHTQLTVRLLEYWRLPDAIVHMAAGTGDEQLPASVRKLAHLLKVADAMAVWLVDRRADALPRLRQSLQSIGSFSEGQLAELFVSLHEKVQQLAHVLSLELPAQHTAEQLTLAAYRELSATARDAAVQMLCQERQPPDEEVLTLDEARRLRQTFAALGEMAVPRGGVECFLPPAIVNRAGNGSEQAATASATNATVMEELVAAVAYCRRNRRPLALALIELDRFDELVATNGLAQAAMMLGRWRDACRELEHEGLRCVNAGGGRLALLLPDCERQDATRLTRQLLGGGGGRAEPRSSAPACGLSVSIGVAAIGQIPRNFPPEELLSAAECSLSGAAASGGNCVKGIDV